MEIDLSTTPEEHPIAALVAAREAIYACRILVVDDEVTNVRLLERLLAKAGFENFISTTDSRGVADLFNDFQPDLVLTDWLMPWLDGNAVIAQIRSLISSDDYLPIVVLTADVTPETRKRALSAGATDFLTKPFDRFEVILRIQNLLQARVSHLLIQKQNATLENCVRERTVDLERTLVELRSTQQQVIQQERLAALGTMAGGIAHDFNNALSIILGYSELLLHDVECGLTKENALLPITTIITAAEDAAKIVHRLREFHRPDVADEQRMAVDLNKIVEQAIVLTQPRWQTEAAASGCKISVVAELGEIPEIAADGAELREMLTNLVFNAVDAMPAGGEIRLTTVREDTAVLLKISDTGTGMSDEVRQHCLEPFYTTKGERGTGLGLSMVFGIVHRHNGTLDIETALGKGTSFLVRLPASAPEEFVFQQPLRSADEPLHVLVVDDQPILCQLVCEYLEDDLHTVETALSGAAALAKFRSTHFDVVITDHVMSEMTGEHLAIALKELRPEVPVILLTGYTGDFPVQEHLTSAIDLVLGKPLSRASLRHAFAQVMGTHAPRPALEETSAAL